MNSVESLSKLASFIKISHHHMDEPAERTYTPMILPAEKFFNRPIIPRHSELMGTNNSQPTVGRPRQGVNSFDPYSCLGNNTLFAPLGKEILTARPLELKPIGRIKELYGQTLSM
jgi:hypothetical protein